MPSISAFGQWLDRETGLQSMRRYGNKDIYVILLTRFVRMFAYGGAALVLGIFLYAAGNKGASIGQFMSLTLLGDAAISYVLTLYADKLGRRRVLMVGSLLMTLAGTVFASTKNYYLLLLAATVGVISPGAHEVGPFRAVEEAVLAQLAPLEARTDVYAWFAVSSTLAMAAGLCFTGYLTWFQWHVMGRDWHDCYQAVFGFYAIMGLVKFSLTFLLSEDCEAAAAAKAPWAGTTVEELPSPSHSEQTSLLTRQSSIAKQPIATKSASIRIRQALPWKVSRSSIPILVRLCILFAINSVAAGMLPMTIMSWYVNWRNRWFLTHRIGYTMSVVWLCASLSNLFSASVARRLGLVRAMVFTHLPSAIFLAFIPLSPTWYILAILMILDAVFGSMDQAPREAFVAAAFLPRERVQAMGTLNLVRTLAASVGPLISGYAHDHKKWWAIFLFAAFLKICYDIGLLVMFLKVPLPEERRRMAVDVTLNGHGGGGGGQQEMSVTAADLDVNVLLDEYNTRGLAPPSDFDIDDEDDYDGDERTVVADDSDGEGRRVPKYVTES